MPIATSKDGTPIAYETIGTGPALVLVDGAMCYRASGPMRPLADALKGDFTSISTTGAGAARAATPSPMRQSARSRTSRR
ncbi:MAG: hypothetical protein WDN31_11995 [Hyphomicrobium sp.]